MNLSCSSIIYIVFLIVCTFQPLHAGPPHAAYIERNIKDGAFQPSVVLNFLEPEPELEIEPASTEEVEYIDIENGLRGERITEIPEKYRVQSVVDPRGEVAEHQTHEEPTEELTKVLRGWVAGHHTHEEPSEKLTKVPLKPKIQRNRDKKAGVYRQKIKKDLTARNKVDENLYGMRPVNDDIKMSHQLKELWYRETCLPSVYFCLLWFFFLNILPTFGMVMVTKDLTHLVDKEAHYEEVSIDPFFLTDIGQLQECKSVSEIHRIHGIKKITLCQCEKFHLYPENVSREQKPSATYKCTHWMNATALNVAQQICFRGNLVWSQWNQFSRKCIESTSRDGKYTKYFPKAKVEKNSDVDVVLGTLTMLSTCCLSFGCFSEYGSPYNKHRMRVEKYFRRRREKKNAKYLVKASTALRRSKRDIASKMKQHGENLHYLELAEKRLSFAKVAFALGADLDITEYMGNLLLYTNTPNPVDLLISESEKANFILEMIHLNRHKVEGKKLLDAAFRTALRHLYEMKRPMTDKQFNSLLSPRALP